MMKQIESLIPETAKANLMLKAFGILKAPLIFATGAKVVHIDDASCSIKMPFRKIIKNHMGSVYFGALSIGADVCIGLLAANKIQQRNEKINFAFKSFNAQFLKRAIGSTSFVCKEGLEIDEMINETLRTGERVNKVIKAYAQTNNEIVAEFELELSLKNKA